MGGISTFYEKHGKIYVPKNSNRNREKVEAWSLPKDADVSIETSMKFHERLKNDVLLRERLVKAQKMIGKTIIHLDMLARDVDANTERKLVRHAEGAEKIQEQKRKEDGKDEKIIV